MSKRKENLETIRDLPDDELVGALDRARDELFRLDLGNYTNQVEDTASLKRKRREVARIKTVMRARKLQLETQTEAGQRESRSAKQQEA